MSFEWFRMWVDAVDDEKLKLLAFEDRWHYVAILCCKRKGIQDGADSAEMRDRKMGVKLGLGERDRDEVRRRLTEVGLINDLWQPLAWGKRQFVSDLDRTATERKRRQRLKEGHGHVTRDSRVSHGQVTGVSLRSDSDSEKNKSLAEPPSAFDRFWTAYPRKVKKKTCRDLWRRKGLDAVADRILADIATRRERDADWKGGFIPHPSTYLSQERWTDELQQLEKTDGYKLAV